MKTDCSDVGKILFTRRKIARRVKKLGAEVSEKYAGLRPVCVCVLKGAAIFFSDFVRALKIDAELDFIAVSTYGAGTSSSGRLNIKSDVSTNLSGRDVIIVEDVVDSGFTMYKLKALFEERGARSVAIAALFDKPDKRKYDTCADFSCFSVGDEFIVGYGLDFDEKFRSLPFVGVLKKSEIEKQPNN